MRLLYTIFSLLLISSCTEEKATLFNLKTKASGFDFINELNYTEEFNPYTYRNFYNGAGVALGDINQDGLVDIYMTGNIVDNKMFLNKGDWQFEDITQRTGLACSGVWSSGANFVDINGDGLLDLYVCKAGKPGGEKRHNELFINQGDLSFKEASKEYGLDIEGMSIQSAFFDYDRDGDLDCYLLNNSIKSIGAFDLAPGARNKASVNGNKFLENINGRFTEVTNEAGIYSSEIGFGLGITLSDFNLDGWTDIYISNDYYEKDYLYLNNGDKSFTEKGEEYFDCFPLGAMGADAGDLNNDLRPDLMITEMLPSNLKRKKTKQLYESWKKYMLSVSKGYSHQMPRNVLQKNNGSQGFQELGRKAGIEATDWSWSCMIQDYDNDGLKDIYVTNGIYKDLLDRDYLAFMANDAKVGEMVNTQDDAITKLINAMPSEAVPNFMFKNKGDFNFENVAVDWGLAIPSFSNGSGYADFDNDGDLDLVVNNVNMASFLYENTAEKFNHHFVKFELKGKAANTQALGTKIIVYACGANYMIDQFPSRGFHSSMSNQLQLGLGQCSQIDSVAIQWPDGTSSSKNRVEINRVILLDQNQEVQNTFAQASKKYTPNFIIDTLSIAHKQQKFNQFNRERLLYRMNPNLGPAISVGDVNGDQKDDLFIGGAKNQSSILALSQTGGYENNSVPFDRKQRSEVTSVQLFDSDNDGDLDLYVGNGGTAFSKNASEVNDEYYENLGGGNFETRVDAFTYPKAFSTGTVTLADYNQDGLIDVFVGENGHNETYGSSFSGYLYENKGGHRFELQEIEEFKNIGMISTAEWLDVNQDGLLDLLVAGEWMPLKLFINTGSGFEEQAEAYGLGNKAGMWNHILVDDLNQDGQPDIFLGNLGSNTSLDTDHVLFISDFDGNGSTEQILCKMIGGDYFPSLDMDELVSQLPFLRRKFLYYKDYADLSMADLFSKETLEKSKILYLQTLDSELFYGGNGGFAKQDLPYEVQLSSVYAAIAKDIDADGQKDLIIGGNHYLVKPQFGREDASKVWLLKGSQNGSELKYKDAESLGIDGELRTLEVLDKGQILLGINNKPLQVLKF